jgi:diguanylate cyclase (GGDEF)-like protein
MAETDPLTGIMNRRGVARFITGDDRCRMDRRGETTVLLLDIDHFKQINDSYGHLVGDEVLRHVAKLLQSFTRQNDLLARWGGEEFLLIQPGTALASSVAWAENLRETLASSTIATQAGDLDVTVSMGICVATDARVDDSDVNRADAALYDAKARGRNCLCLWDSTAFCQTAKASEANRFEVRLAETFGRISGALGETQREHLTAHSRAVAAISMQIARHLPLSESLLHAVREAALAHDLGKVAVPESILAKPGPLDPAERTLIKRHPFESAHLAHALGASPASCAFVLQSRDRYDDLATERCLPAATVGVADAFAAMTARRPYQPSRSPVQALAELRRMSGCQFDPRAVDAACVALASA